MCNAANMNYKTHVLVAIEVLMYSAALGNLVMDKGITKTHYQMIGLHNPKSAEPKLMQTIGVAGVVTRSKNGKLSDWGILMVFEGYAKNQSHNCYRIWNPALCKVTES